jgi:DNA processing protein
MSAPAVELLTLLRLPGIGPRGAVSLAESSLDEQRGKDGWPEARSEADAIVDDCVSLGIGIVGWFDAEFPERLREIPDAPAVLFYRGDLEVVQRSDLVAVVGTREPSSWGMQATRSLTRALAGEGWGIVSGLALGVDTLAHETALDEGAPTIAILGNGLATVYPAANRALARRIEAAGGLLLAEVPPRRKVEPRALVKRDRLQSGLAAITIVCQGGTSSGAMHTARYAYEQGRPLFCAALPRQADSPGAQDEGTRVLLEEPAQRLPELLPAWKRVSPRRLGRGPIARPLDHAHIPELGKRQPPLSPPRLF